MYAIALQNPFEAVFRFFDGLIADALGDSSNADDSAQKVDEAKEAYAEAKENGGDTTEALEKVVEAQEEHFSDVVKETVEHDKVDTDE